MIDIDGLDYTGSRPEVFFRFRGVDMSADLDPCVIAPVVIRGSAAGCEVNVEFREYEKLQEAITRFNKTEGEHDR